MTKHFGLWFVIFVIALLKLSHWWSISKSTKKAHTGISSCSHRQFFKKKKKKNPVLFDLMREDMKLCLKHHKKQPQGCTNTRTHILSCTHTHTHLKSFPLCPHVHGVTHNEVYFASWKNNSYITWDLQIHKVCTHNPHHTVYERGVL